MNIIIDSHGTNRQYTYLLKCITASKMKDDPFRLLREQKIQRIQWMEWDGHTNSMLAYKYYLTHN